MGNSTSQHTSALGGFSDKGIGVHLEKRKKLSGRFVDTRFAANDELIAFLTGDVLPRVHTSARYSKAIKVDDHTVFLLANGEAIIEPEAAWTAFVNTFKGLLEILQVEAPEKFADIRFGSHQPSTTSPASKPAPGPYRSRIQEAMATYAHGGFDGHNRDS